MQSHATFPMLRYATLCYSDLCCRIQKTALNVPMPVPKCTHHGRMRILHASLPFNTSAGSSSGVCLNSFDFATYRLTSIANKTPSSSIFLAGLTSFFSSAFSFC